ncbi:MAG: hypothetical protein JNK61_05840 [Bacteroidia bacterium]|nr:hypothetical protein [Bacteroidia bacterium]
MVRDIIFCLLIFLMPVTTIAQTWILFNQSNSGLPDNAVKCLAFDNSNVLWIGTDNGLARFDGTNWNTYNTGNSGIASNQIRSIAFDSLNRLWVGTFNNGACSFDGTNWTVFNTQNSSIASNTIKGISTAPNGDVWFATTNGLSVYNDTLFTTYNIFNSGLATNHFTHVAVGLNQLFIGSINGGFATYDSLFHAYTIVNSGFPDNTTLSTALDTNQKAWIATPSSGLVVYLNPNSWITYNTNNSGMPVNSLNDLCFDGVGNLWMTSPTQGLILKNATNFTHYTTQNSALPSNQLHCLFYNQGILWIGSTFDGLVKLSFNAGINNHYNNDLLFPNPASQNIMLPSNFDHMRITNCFGKVIIDAPIMSTIVTVASWPSGVYCCELTSNNGLRKIYKVVVAH